MNRLHLHSSVKRVLILWLTNSSLISLRKNESSRHMIMSGYHGSNTTRPSIKYLNDSEGRDSKERHVTRDTARFRYDTFNTRHYDTQRKRGQSSSSSSSWLRGVAYCGGSTAQRQQSNKKFQRDKRKREPSVTFFLSHSAWLARW